MDYHDMDVIIRDICQRFGKKVVSTNQLQNGDLVVVCFASDKEVTHSSLSILNLLKFNEFIEAVGNEIIVWWGMTRMNQCCEDIVVVLFGTLKLERDEIYQVMSLSHETSGVTPTTATNRIEKIVLDSLSKYAVDMNIKTDKYIVCDSVDNYISITMRLIFSGSRNSICIPGNVFVKDIVETAAKYMKLTITELTLLSEPRADWRETTLLLTGKRELNFTDEHLGISCEDANVKSVSTWPYGLLLGLLCITFYFFF